MKQDCTGSLATVSTMRGKGEIVAVAGVEPHAVGVATRQNAEAVVLDLMNPSGACRWLLGRFGEARCDGGTGAEGRAAHRV